MRTVVARFLMLFGLVAAMTSTAGVATAAASADEPVMSAADDPLLHRQARSDEELRQQIALQLKLAPGGKQTAPNEVTYGNGTFVVTYALPSSTSPVSVAAAPDCPTGWFCFYDGANYVYPRGKLSSCKFQDLATWGWSDRTSSVHNSRGPRVDYREHFDYGDPSNGHFYDYFLFSNTNGQAIPSLGSNNNKADHVYLYC